VANTTEYFFSDKDTYGDVVASIRRLIPAPLRILNSLALFIPGIELMNNLGRVFI
jgi:hypothetical protein